MKMFVLMIALVLNFFCFAEEPWKFVEQKDGISIYKRGVEESSVKEYKSTGIVNANVWTIAALMSDLSSYSQWNGNCIYAEIIVPKKDNVMIQYFINSAPWPVKGRDVILKTSEKIDISRMSDDYNENAVIEITIDSVEEALVPLKKEYVRIKKLKGLWLFEGLKDNTTKVTYIISADIGGDIPGILNNIVNKDIPYKTIMGIRKMIKLEKYIEAGRKYILSIKRL